MQVAEKTQWRIMPTGLKPGSYDSQDASALTYWLGVMSFEAKTREKLEIDAQRAREKSGKRKR